ncbi:glycoside hydrolase family 25 protein [Flavicella sp.]|uniref:glycoside hydrolase family 25 protein n=1 Tax=Flavicella sp. TaxID=2957742 RepID=UPI00262417E6|nr:glycoside hydrolase family 25 protein [Flavicella sp.]MDG1804944.1 glycoside hydrolase family 25 protein [Flavicella sp.]
MKKILFQLKANSWFYGCALILLGMAIATPFHNTLISYLEKLIDNGTLSLGVLIDLKSVSEAAGSSKLILIAGASENITDLLASSIKYLSWSDLLLSVQLVLIKLSGSSLVKILSVLAFIGTFFINYRTIATKILLFLFVLNPGLPAFVSGVKYISKEMQFEQADSLHKNLSDLHDKYKEKELSYEHFEKIRDEKQLAKAEKSGKTKLNFFTRVGDATEDDFHLAAEHIEEGVSEFLIILKSASKTIIIQTLNLLSSIVFQFLLLPFAFFYGIHRLLKYSTEASGKDQTYVFQKLVVVETIFVFLIGVSVMTGQNTEKQKKSVPPIDKKSMIGNQNHAKQKHHLGIDVSHFQQEINWEEIKEANISFAYSKATQGKDYVDPRFHENWKNMGNVSLSKGAYHFYQSNDSGKEQAIHFCKTVGNVGKGDIPPVLDLEGGGIIGTVHKKELQKEIHIWLRYVHQKMGVKPIIYTNNVFANDYLLGSDFSEYHLWIAEYGVEEPKIPLAWKNKKWLIWQRTPRGKIEGVLGNVDHDIATEHFENLIVKKY